MDKDCRHRGSSGFSNGFLLGAVVGGSLVFLIGTKRGKQVLKAMTENGFEGISELADLLSDDDDEMLTDEYKEYAENGADPAKANNNSAGASKPVRAVKRFFRGIKK